MRYQIWPRLVLSILCGTLISPVPSPVVADQLNLGGPISLGVWSPHATRYQISRQICAWSSTPDLRYRVIASIPESPQGFELLNELGDRIRFDIRWRDYAISTSWERLLPGLPSSNTYAFASTASCTGSNPELQIRLSKGDSDKAPGGQYSSTLTILLVAE
ncbi:MAG: hypothetical protein AB8B64_16515 [Granulosicoccus sp.]